MDKTKTPDQKREEQAHPGQPGYQQGGTFVDVEFGMDPKGARNWIFDASLGKLFFRRWLDQSLTALEQVAAVKR